MGLSFLLHRATDFPMVNQARRRAFEAADRLASTVWLDIHSRDLLFDGARHFCSLTMQLADLGHRVAIVDHPGNAYRLAYEPCGAAVLSCPNVYLCPPSVMPPAGAYVFSDSPPCGDNQISIQVVAGSCRLAGAAVYPFPVDPCIRPYLTSARLARSRGRKQRAKLLYCEDPRCVRSSGPAGVRSSRCSPRELLHHLQTRLGGFCVPLDSDSPMRQQPIQIVAAKSHARDPREWLETLSQFHFCVCCSGATYPISHQMIEAMSVGTIPILEHANCFTPPLSNFENAIVFSSLSEFDDAIRRVMQLDESSIQRMRRNVIAYYDTHLQPEPFVNRLLMTARMRGGAVLSIPYLDFNLDPATLAAASLGGDRAIAA